MITILICMLLCVAYQVYRRRESIKLLGDGANQVCAGALKGCVLGLVAAFVFSMFLPTIVVQDKPIELVSMRTQDSLSGAFIFGSGQVGSKVSYRFMKRSSDGFITVDTVVAERGNTIRIKEEESLKNTGNLVISRAVVDATHWFARYFTLGGLPLNVQLGSDFHVPVGTVVQEFKVQ